MGVWQDGRAQLVPNSLGDVLTPSAVSISDSGELLVGMAARERQSTHPRQTATAFKRLIRRAGQMAGLKVERLINEPTAAALARSRGRAGGAGHGRAALRRADRGHRRRFGPAACAADSHLRALLGRSAD